MNRFKKELRKHGVKMENDFPWMPYEENGIALEARYVNAETCTVRSYYNVIDCVVVYDRQMVGHEIYED